MSQHAQAFAPPAPSAGAKRDLIGLSSEEMAAEMATIGEKTFRGRQLWRWVYTRGVTDFAAMTDLAKDFRGRLAETHVVSRPRIVSAQTSSDGTRKWLLAFADGQQVETVYIPEEDRGTLCISSQVGCTLTCKFCHTGTQRLVRNLSAGEIVGQVMLARDELDDWSSLPEGRRITNIVMMGMGEPLYNYDNVAGAVRLMMDGDGIAISKRKITLSTSGVVPEMARCGEELGVNLAVSLHAVTDEVRAAIMPINKKYPLAELIAACRAYPGVNNARRITFEYVMLKGINDSAEDAHSLVRLLDGIPAKVNLIPFNPWPGVAYERSAPGDIERFARILNEAMIAAPIRATRPPSVPRKPSGQRKPKARAAGGGPRVPRNAPTTGPAGQDARRTHEAHSGVSNAGRRAPNPMPPSRRQGPPSRHDSARWLGHSGPVRSSYRPRCDPR
jgi:23S rRNA (adenine2503-C2)-methyltransferase